MEFVLVLAAVSTILAFVGFHYDWFGEVFVLVVVATAFATAMVVGVAMLTRAECRAIDRMTPQITDHEWAFIGGCFVEVNGEVIPLDRWLGVTRQGE